MHTEAFEYVQRHATDDPVEVLEVGSFNVNGGVRDLFPNADFFGIDIRPGRGVDLAVDAADWEPDRLYDVVVSTEVLEHTPRWRDVVATCGKALKPGGKLILTCAGPGREPHSVNGWVVMPNGEHYENVAPDVLAEEVSLWGSAVCELVGTDTQCVAYKTEAVTA